MHRIILTCALAVVLTSTAFAGPTVRFDVTDIGWFEVELYDTTPISRDNFMAYVSAGLYNSTIIHRSDYSNGVIQGGGFIVPADPYVPEDLATFGTIAYEGDIGGSNTVGTLGMARSSDPNSASSQWYINLQDNSGWFDHQGDTPGYTVFGEVTAGWQTVLDIYALNVYNASGAFYHGAFGTLPLMDSFDGSADLTQQDFVTIASVTPEPATVALLALGGLALLRRRARK